MRRISTASLITVTLFWLGIFSLQSQHMLAQARRFASGMFTNPNSWSQGSSAAMTNISGTHRHITTANGTGDRFFRLYSETSGGTWYQPAPNDQFVNLNTTITLNATGCCDNKAYFINAPNTSDNYVFLTRPNGGNQELRILRIGGTIRAVANAGDVTRVIPGGGSTVYRSMDVTVKATLDGAKHADQGVYLRYTNNSFSTSTVVEMTLDAGNTYQATIPAGTNTAGSTVQYYVFTSRSGETIASADADFMTINLQNNGGSNYSYVVNSAYATKTGTLNWNTASSWWGDAVPPASSAVAILGSVTMNTNPTVSEVRIESGATLNAGSNTITVNGSAGQRFINVGTFNAGTGTVEFINAGAKTINGTVTFNNITTSTGVQFGVSSSTCTINGTFTINSGGAVSAYAPTYASGSTLRYNTGGTFARGTEWLAGVSGAGIPHHVTIGGSTTLNLGAARNALGDLTIESGSTLNFQTINAACTFFGSLNMNGNLTLSTAASGFEFRVRTNLNLNNASGLTANGQVITLDGATSGTITSTLSSVPDVARLRVNKSGGANVNLAKALTITSALALSAGEFTVGSNLNTGFGVVNVTRSAGSLSATYNNIVGTVAVFYSGFSGSSGNELPSTDSKIAGIYVQSSSNLTQSKNITLAGSSVFSIENGGTYNSNNFRLLGGGTFQMVTGGVLNVNNADGFPDAVGAGVLAVSGGTINFNRGSAQITGTFDLENADVSIINNTPVTMSGNIGVRTMTIGAGSSLSCGSFTLSLGRTTDGTALTTNGTFNAQTGTVFCKNSGIKIFLGTMTLNNIQTSTGVRFGNVSPTVTINGTFTLLSGGFVSTQPPIYGSGSTLVYSTGGSYSRNLEWGTSVAQRPHHVIVNTTTLNLNQGSTAYGTSGDFTINSGGSFSMGSGTGYFFVFGNSDLSGAVTLSSSVGGDFWAYGDVSFSSASFTHNNRELRLLGGTNTNLTSSASSLPNLPFLLVNKNSGSQKVTLQKDLTVTTRLRLEQGLLETTPGVLTLNSGSTISRANGTISTAPTLLGAINVNYEDVSSPITTGVEIPALAADLLAINVNGNGRVSASGNITLNTGRTFNISSSGIFNTNGFQITGAGTFNLNGGQLLVSNTNGISDAITISNRNFNSGSVRLVGGSAMNIGPIAGLSNINIFVEESGTVATLNGSITARSLTISSGATFNGGANAFNIIPVGYQTSINNNGTFQHGNGTFNFGGTGGVGHTIDGSSTTTFYNLNLTPASGLLQIEFGPGGRSRIANGGRLRFDAGTFACCNGPTYETGSILQYNSGGTFGISFEWNNPHHVEVTNGTILNMGGIAPSLSRQAMGNLTVDATSVWAMDFGGSEMTAAVTINGSIYNFGIMALSPNFGGDLNVGGDFEMKAGSLVNFYSRQVQFFGSKDPQTLKIETASTPTIPFLAINKSAGTWLLDGNLNIGNGSGSARFWLEAGNVNLQGYTLTPTGAGTKTFRVDAGSLITGGTDIYSGGLWNTYAKVATPNTLGGTITFSGNADADLPGVTYDDIILQDIGNRSLQGNATVVGKMTIVGNNAIFLQNSNTFTWGSSSTLEYSGVGAITTKDELKNATFPYVLNAKNTGELIIDGSLQIAGTINLEGGDILLDPIALLTLGASASEVGVLNRTGNQKIVGAFRRWFNTTTGLREFPIGALGFERGVDINFTTAPSTAGTIRVEFIPGVPDNPNLGLPISFSGIDINTVGINGVWKVTPMDGLTGGVYDISMKAYGFLGVNDFSRLVMLKRTNSDNPWQVFPSNQLSTLGTNDEPIMRMTGLNSFSEFSASGEWAENPLPVVLGGFSGKLKDGVATLNWHTLSERDADYFSIEKSESATGPFTLVGIQKAQGTTLQTIHYSLVDPKAESGWYYRLKQHDLNGKVQIEGLIRLSEWAENEEIRASVYPNPIGANSRIEFTGTNEKDIKIFYELYTTNGKLLLTNNGKSSDVSNEVLQKINSSAKGVYVLKCNANGKVLPTLKLTKF